MATDHNFKVKNGLEVLGGNLSLSGDSRKIEMLDGTTNSQPSIAIGEQSNWGVRQRWDSGQKVIFEGWWNSATSGSVNRDFGYLDAYNTKWRFNDYVGINVDANTNYRLYVNGNIRADGAYYVGGQTVIDSSRNLTNIGTISSGAIDAGGRIKATNWIELESAGAAITSEEAGIRIDYNDTAAWYLYKDNANGAALHIQSAAVDSDGSPRVRFNRTVRETYIGGALAVNQYSISSGYALDVSGTARSGAHTIYTQASTLEGINLVANVSSANQNSDSPKIQFNGEYQSNGPYIQGDNVGSYGYKSLKFYTNRNSGTDYTTAPTVTLTLDSTGNAQFAGTLTSGAITSTGAVQGAVLRAASTGPTITLNDTDAANATNQVGYISFQRQGSEKAWLGYGSNGNADFSIRNTEGPITLLSNLESAYTIESGAITTTGNIQQNYGYELRGKDSGGSARTLLRTNSNKLQIGWSYAGDVEFMGGGSYTKRMAISGTTGDISIANDLDVAGDMQFTSQNHEWSAGASGSGNNILGKVGNAGAAGIVLKDVNNVFRVQLYGDGTNYGFLNAEWASWDFKKEIGGSLYLNNNTNYNLRPDGTTNLNNLNVVGNLTVSGTTTTLNTANLAVEDNNITLNYSTGDSSASANGAGITIQDAVDASTDATILWDAGNDEFDFSHTITLPQDKFIHFGTSAWKIGANGNDLNIFSSDDVNVYAGWQRFFYSNVEYARIGSSGGNWVTGNTEIKTGSVTLGTGYNLQWGGAYGSGKPTISATGNALFFYPTGNVSGANFRLYADMAEIRDGNALRFQRAGNSAYGELTYDSGENITLYSSWGGKYLRLTRDGNLQLSGTTRISHAGDITSSTGLLSNSRQNYASGTAGWLLELDIATNNYAHIHGTIKLQQFNFNTQQIVNFSATVLNNGTVNTKAATSDIDITLKLFVYNSKWYVYVPAPSTYTDISAYVHMGAGYQGTAYSESCLLSISNSGVPSSGVTGSVDIVAKKRAFEDDDVTFGAITANNTGNAVIAQYNSTNYTALRYDGVDTVLGGDGVYRRGGTEKLRLTTSGASINGTLGTGAITTNGTLHLAGGNYEGLIKFGTNAAWHCGIRQHDDADAEMRIWHKNANGMIFLATGYDGEPATLTRPTDGLAIQGNKLGIGNFSSVDPQAKLHVKHTGDFQLLLDGDTTSWAGIRFKDTNGQDDIWYAGDGDTFSIGGSGSTGITNKKLHVHGATTIGSGMKQLSMPTDGLRVEGNIEANSNLILGNGSSSGVLKLYTYDDAANHWDAYTWTDDTFRLNYNGAGSDEFILDSSGNVQITGDIWINKGSQGGLIQFGQSTSGDYLKLQDISSGSNVLELYQDADLKFGIDGVTGDTYVKGRLRTADEGIYGNMSSNFHSDNALRGGVFSTDIANDTTVLKLFPSSANDDGGNVRANNDYNTGIGFMHLDPAIWGTSYLGMQAWIGLRVHDLSGQERDFLTFATNNSTTSGTFPVERMCISPEGHVGINVTDPNHGLAVSGGGTMTAGWNKSLMMKANFPVLTFHSVAGSGGYSGIGYDASTGEHAWNFWHRGTSEDVAGTARLPFAIKTSEVVINESSHNTDFRVETDANENMLLVDASGGTVQVGHGNTGWAELDVQGDISIRGPSNFGTLEFRRGANSLVFARIGFDNPSLANDTFVIDSSGNGNPLGFLTNSDPIYFWVGNNTGATADVRIENAGGMVINENGNDSDFRVESNNQDHMLFVDAGNDLVGIGRSDPAHALDVYKASPAGGVVARFQSAADSWIQLKGTTGRSYQIGATGSALRFYDDTTQRYMFDISSSASGPVNAHGYREGALTVVANTNYSGWVRVARSALATNGYGARGAFRVTVAGTGGYLGPGEVSVSGFKNWSDLAAITRTEYASSQYFESARVTMDANYAYLELSLRGTLNVGGNSQFYVRVWNTGLYGDRWTPYTENLTAGLSSPTYTSVTRTWNNVASGAVAVANIRMTSGADVYASGSGWDDCLNLWSSDATKYWNLLVDNGVGDSLRFATNQSGSLVEVARFDYDQINLYKTIYAQFAEFNTGSDIQVRLRSPDNWAGIQFQDSNGTEQIYYNGQHSTFAIGGGGSNVSGKKLHVDGGMTVGASLDSTSNYTDGITVAGGIDSQNAIKINYEGNGNNGTDACIAVYHTSADWGLKIEKLITGTYYDYGIINNGSGTYAYHQKNQGTETIRFNYNGNALFAGNVTAYASLSDVRLKEDIDTIPDALDKVCRLDGVTFNYKKDGVRSTGLLAQQLLEVLPEAVYKTEELDGDIEDQYYAINYGNTVGLLVEAIKDLKQENDELKTMIAQIAKKLGD